MRNDRANIAERNVDSMDSGDAAQNRSFAIDLLRGAPCLHQEIAESLLSNV